MARGRGHRGNLLEIGTELNIVPYLDMMTCLVMFLLVTMTGFLSFSILNASIPQLSPNAEAPIPDKAKKEQLLLIVRMTNQGFVVDPNVQGGAAIKRMDVQKQKGEYDFLGLNQVAANLKKRFADETKVLLIADPKVIYDNIIKTMDALRQQEETDAPMFTDVTLSIF